MFGVREYEKRVVTNVQSIVCSTFRFRNSTFPQIIENNSENTFIQQNNRLSNMLEQKRRLLKEGGNRKHGFDYVNVHEYKTVKCLFFYRCLFNITIASYFNRFKIKDKMYNKYLEKWHNSKYEIFQKRQKKMF